MADGRHYSDYELIQAWLGGDQRAFEELFRRYKRPLYGYLSRMLTHDAMTVDDIFQQLWLRVMKKLPDYREQDRFGAWLFRIGRNLVIDHYRSRGRRPGEVSLEEFDGAEVPGDAPDEPWRGLDDAALQAAVEEAVEELPPEQKEVFICRRNSLTFREIAEIQACPVNTALARMQYALKFLRKRLDSWGSRRER